MNRCCWLIVVLLICLQSCSYQSGKEGGLAEANGQVLYRDEISAIVPEGSSREDSVLIADNYIQQWIKKQLMVSKAELNLRKEDKNVERMVNNYRSSLLIHKYQQQLLEQKLDTLVTDSEIEDYYKKNEGNFILNENIVKALYIKIEKQVPNYRKIKKLYQSKKKEDWEELKAYCLQNATKFDDFGNNWIPAKFLLANLPHAFTNEKSLLKNRKFIETEDSTYCYFAGIKEVKFKESLAPLEFIKEDIRKIAINKRKIKFIKDLEKDIYRDAEQKNRFKIY